MLVQSSWRGEMAAIRVPVADDDYDNRVLLCRGLSEDPRFELVGEVADGADALRTFETTPA